MSQREIQIHKIETEMIQIVKKSPLSSYVNEDDIEEIVGTFVHYQFDALKKPVEIKNLLAENIELIIESKFLNAENQISIDASHIESVASELMRIAEAHSELLSPTPQNYFQ